MTISDEYVIVTGGLGYIGSHTVIELLQHNYKVIILDNLANSKLESLDRIRSIVYGEINGNAETPSAAGHTKDLIFRESDIRDYKSLYSTVKDITRSIVDSASITSIIHFAGLKSVADSVTDPISYYETNFIGTLNVLKLIESKRANGREQEEELLLPRLQNFIFSSSATVYGDVKFHGFEVPIKETTPLLAPTSPYGESKLLVEKLLRQFIESDRIVNGDVKLKVGVLRYFNPIGAHSSGLIGEDSLGKPTNLLPILGGIAIVKWKDQKLRKNMETSTPAEINVYGIDYDTVDGTPIRDYIHIEDLSSGHLSCLNYLKNLEDGETFYREWNLGTGRGYTVLEIIDEFNKNVGVEIQHRLVDRRPGDVEILLANPDRAISELHWSCQRSIADACKDLWSWLKNLHSQ